MLMQNSLEKLFDGAILQLIKKEATPYKLKRKRIRKEFK